MQTKVRTQINLPTENGNLQIVSFYGEPSIYEDVAICIGQWKSQSEPKVRIHSECFTGDVLRSRKCDCGDQLDEVLKNQEALTKARHWGVPTMTVRGEPFFGQDRIDTLRWRLEQYGLKRS